MSDRRLRELARRWRASGSSDDEAAYLLERVRVGDLARDRLALAAFCGHDGARRAVGRAPPSGEEVSAWANELRASLGMGAACAFVQRCLATHTTDEQARRIAQRLHDTEQVSDELVIEVECAAFALRGRDAHRVWSLARALAVLRGLHAGLAATRQAEARQHLSAALRGFRPASGEDLRAADAVVQWALGSTGDSAAQPPYR